MKKINILFLFLPFQSFTQAPVLDVAGEIKVKGNNAIELGVGMTKQFDAGKIAYSRWTPNTLEIVGGGINDGVRKIKFWNEGGASFVGNLGVGVDNPNDKLAVNGLIQTSQGIKFPDQSIQNTAAFNAIESFPNQNALQKKQPFALIITGNSPTIVDTLEIVELIGGGVSRAVSKLQSSISAGAPRQEDIMFTINLENATQTILNRITDTGLSKLTIYFPELNNIGYQKAIEVRTVFLTTMNFHSNFIGNNQYANLLTLGFAYGQIEIRSINANSCFCWDFISQTPCNCD